MIDPQLNRLCAEVGRGLPGLPRRSDVSMYDILNFDQFMVNVIAGSTTYYDIAFKPSHPSKLEITFIGNASSSEPEKLIFIPYLKSDGSIIGQIGYTPDGDSAKVKLISYNISTNQIKVVSNGGSGTVNGLITVTEYNRQIKNTQILPAGSASTVYPFPSPISNLEKTWVGGNCNGKNSGGWIRRSVPGTDVLGVNFLGKDTTTSRKLRVLSRSTYDHADANIVTDNIFIIEFL